MLHLVAFYSRKLISAEEQYEIYDKEMLAIVECLKQWRVYLLRVAMQTRVFTDHKNLEYFTTMKVLNKRQAWWAEELAEYNFIIIYHTGALNMKANLFLRRANYFPKEEEAAMAELPLLHPGQWIVATFGLAVFNLDENLAAQLKKAYGKDENYQEAIKDMQSGNEWDFSLSKEGVLLQENQIYMPDDREIQMRLMAEHYDELTAGYLGCDKTLELLSWNYHLPSIRKYMETYVAMCNICARAKALHHKLFGLL